MNTFFTKFADVYFNTATISANTHGLTLQNNKEIGFYKTLNNTMYTGAAQANITTGVVHVIVLSCTTHFLMYTP